MSSSHNNSLPHIGHRKLGEELDLFHFPLYAPGMPAWHAGGMAIWQELAQLSRECNREYEEVCSPQLCHRSLWEQSGHWEKFREGMFAFDDVGLKPMSCPGHADIFASRPRSWRDMPIRYAEFGHVHRFEPSGSLNGLLRVRAFVQDDAHIFARPDGVPSELKRCIDMIERIYSVFGFQLQAEISLRPAERIGDDALWDIAEEQLRKAVVDANIPFIEEPGEGAFYGPKIDLFIQDGLGRQWQMGSIQLDYGLPERFELQYINEQNKGEQPVMIHRAAFGSFERFIGILLEHYNGVFPLWLAPLGVRILPISAEQNEYASRIVAELGAIGIRCDQQADGSLGERIAKAHQQRIPAVIVVGQREAANESVALRRWGSQQQQSLSIADAICLLDNERQGRIDWRAENDS